MIALPHFSPWLETLTVLYLCLALVASAHVILTKEDSRSAAGWVGIIWLAPFLGTFLYVVLGINRIRRTAKAWRGDPPDRLPPQIHSLCSDAQLTDKEGIGAQWVPLAQLVGRVALRPLLFGNAVTPLENGDEAFAAMIESIDCARQSIALSTYIFDNDRVGRRFAEALGRAVGRGVEVRVLIDDIGVHYSFPAITHALRKRRVPVALTDKPYFLPRVNLREHRKILVIDGRVGFTGGMNLREDHQLSLHPRRPTIDLQFRLEGPVVRELQEAFAIEWAFATAERLEGPRWFADLSPDYGHSIARVITAGPDEPPDRLPLILTGALACARSRIAIVTPYFLPEAVLATNLRAAAARGVVVDIFLPGRNNLPFVKWASMVPIRGLARDGCRIWLSQPPFDHTKLMVVDDTWVLFGSSNWDTRSFRLNFELDVECYDPGLAASLMALVEKKRARAQLLDADLLDGQALGWKLRDGIAHLFAPYL